MGKVDKVEKSIIFYNWKPRKCKIEWVPWGDSSSLQGWEFGLHVLSPLSLQPSLTSSTNLQMLIFKGIFSQCNLTIAMFNLKNIPRINFKSHSKTMNYTCVLIRTACVLALCLWEDTIRVFLWCIPFYQALLSVACLALCNYLNVSLHSVLLCYQSFLNCLSSRLSWHNCWKLPSINLPFISQTLKPWSP